MKICRNRPPFRGHKFHGALTIHSQRATLRAQKSSPEKVLILNVELSSRLSDWHPLCSATPYCLRLHFWGCNMLIHMHCWWRPRRCARYGRAAGACQYLQSSCAALGRSRCRKQESTAHKSESPTHPPRGSAAGRPPPLTARRARPSASTRMYWSPSHTPYGGQHERHAFGGVWQRQYQSNAAPGTCGRSRRRASALTRSCAASRWRHARLRAGLGRPDK